MITFKSFSFLSPGFLFPFQKHKAISTVDGIDCFAFPVVELICKLVKFLRASKYFAIVWLDGVVDPQKAKVFAFNEERPFSVSGDVSQRNFRGEIVQGSD